MTTKLERVREGSKHIFIRQSYWNKEGRRPKQRHGVRVLIGAHRRFRKWRRLTGSTFIAGVAAQSERVAVNMQHDVHAVCRLARRAWNKAEFKESWEVPTRLLGMSRDVLARVTRTGYRVLDQVGLSVMTHNLNLVFRQSTKYVSTQITLAAPGLWLPGIEKTLSNKIRTWAQATTSKQSVVVIRVAFRFVGARTMVNILGNANKVGMDDDDD